MLKPTFPKQTFPKKYFSVIHRTDTTVYFSFSVIFIICLSCIFKVNKPKYPADPRTYNQGFMPVLHKICLSGPVVTLGATDRKWLPLLKLGGHGPLQISPIDAVAQYFRLFILQWCIYVVWRGFCKGEGPVFSILFKSQSIILCLVFVLEFIGHKHKKIFPSDALSSNRLLFNNSFT